MAMYIAYYTDDRTGHTDKVASFTSFQEANKWMDKQDPRRGWITLCTRGGTKLREIERKFSGTPHGERISWRSDRQLTN